MAHGRTGHTELGYRNRWDWVVSAPTAIVTYPETGVAWVRGGYEFSSKDVNTSATAIKAIAAQPTTQLAVEPSGVAQASASSTLANPMVSRPLSISVRKEGDEYLAEIPEIEVYVFAPSLEEAIDELSDDVIDLYQEIAALTDSELGTSARRWKKLLTTTS